MAKKPPPRTEEDVKKDTMRLDHEARKRTVADLKAKRARVLDLFNDPVTSTVFKRFQTEIEEKKEALVNIDKKDFEKYQAEIRARRSLLATLQGAYEYELNEAQRDLKEFEEKNELFLQAPTVKASDGTVADAETGEVVAAAG